MDNIVPPLRWLWANAERRRRVWTYWIVDPLVGAYNTTLHYSMRLLSIDACSNLGAFLSFYSPFFYRESDARARRAWIKLRPEQSDPASVDAAIRRLWRCISRTMAEYSIIDQLWDAGRISVEGAQHLQAARAAEKPILIAMLHLGNWEVVAVTSIKLGFAGPGIYVPLDNRFDMRLAIKTRKRYSLTQQIPAGPHALRFALGTLRQKREPFGIFVDEFIRGRVHAPAFGRPPRAEGNIAYAARLAAMTHATLIPAYCVRLDDSARFKVHFLPPVELVQTGDRDADILANTGRVDAAIEPIIRKYLDQWYFLLDFEFDD